MSLSGVGRQRHIHSLYKHELGFTLKLSTFVNSSERFPMSIAIACLVSVGVVVASYFVTVGKASE